MIFKVRIMSPAWLVAMLMFFHAAASGLELNENSFDKLDASTVIEYVQTHDMLGPSQAILVLIFGNGRVEVTLPPINPRSGRYELMLTPAELNELVLSTVEADRAPVLSREEVGLFYVSESTRTSIKVHLNSLTSDTGALETLAGPIEIAESDLGIKQSATSRGAVSRTSSLFAVEQQLLELTTDPRLERK